MLNKKKNFIDTHENFKCSRKLFLLDLIPDSLVHCLNKKRNEHQSVWFIFCHIAKYMLKAIVYENFSTERHNCHLTAGYFIGMVRRKRGYEGVVFII